MNMPDQNRQTAIDQLIAERDRLRSLLLQAPALICVLSGPRHILEFVHPLIKKLFGNRPLDGKPILAALPELAGSPIIANLDHAYTTGEVIPGEEVPIQIDTNNDGILKDCYFNYTYQPIYNTSGQIDGVMVFAIDVTEQVTARQQAQAA